MTLYNLGQFDEISCTDFKVELCNSFIQKKIGDYPIFSRLPQQHLWNLFSHFDVDVQLIKYRAADRIEDVTI